MLTHFLRRFTKANRPRIAPPSQLPKLKLEQLEARDVPALFAVQLVNSVAGDTAATITDSLAANSSLPTDANGATLVEANSIQEAIGLAITGSVVVQFGGDTYTYSMAPGNVGVNAGEHRPFVGSSSVIQLEERWAYIENWDQSEVPINKPSSAPNPLTAAFDAEGHSCSTSHRPRSFGSLSPSFPDSYSTKSSL